MEVEVGSRVRFEDRQSSRFRKLIIDGSEISRLARWVSCLAVRLRKQMLGLKEGWWFTVAA
jgi:hypothetical protein